MDSEARLKKIQQFIDRMPSLSTTVAKVLEICNNPIASANDLNRVISYDPVLTGHMLKLINSAYYGLPNRITSLTRAIVMLGVNTVKNMVLATSVLAGCKNLAGNRHFSIDDFWTHSLCVGVLSKMIAHKGQVPLIEQEEYFITGLLHDLGKLPMMACFPDLYGRAVDQSTGTNTQLVQSETMHLGISHCQVGVLIAAKWKLSPSVLEAIHKHHSTEPVSDFDYLIRSIGLANHAANLFKMGSAGDRFLDPQNYNTLADRMGISTQALSELKPQLESEVDKARVFLQISKKERQDAH